MNLSAIPESVPPNNVRLPRTRAGVIRNLVVWLIVIPLAHGGVPWAISRLTPRHGWIHGSPGIWNWLGLAPIALATALLIWSIIWKRRSASFLTMRGPYRFSRNPIYVGYLGLWLGWTIFLGSAAVFIGWIVLSLVASLMIVPREEHDLEAAFGEAYLQYKSRVPRWFGKPRS